MLHSAQVVVVSRRFDKTIVASYREMIIAIYGLPSIYTLTQKLSSVYSSKSVILNIENVIYSSWNSIENRLLHHWVEYWVPFNKYGLTLI